MWPTASCLMPFLSSACIAWCQWCQFYLMTSHLFEKENDELTDRPMKQLLNSKIYKK